MLICPICGKVNAEGSRNCDLCGAPLSGVAPTPISTISGPIGNGYNAPPQPNGNGSGPVSEQFSGPVCPVCKRTNRSISVFCAFCGYRLKPGDPLSGPQPPVQMPSAQPLQHSPNGANVAPVPAADEAGNIASNTVLKRRYRILRKVAQGGMGAVYEAIDTHAPAGTRWAVKEMSPAALPASERTQAIADFRREAQMLAGLHHPNLPQVVETFEQLGKYFLVMEFVPGQTLQHVLEGTPGFLPEERVRVWARQIFDVINYLHSQNPPIIYRDIKPANVMLLEGTERIKLIDFGIARFHKAGKNRDTEAFGTAGYAPPEQYGKGQTDQRSDVYALGATLHYLLTKHDPGLNPFNWLPARQYNPAISAQMDSALQRALMLDPQRRFQTILEFAAAVGLGAPVQQPVQYAPVQRPPEPVVQSAPVAAPAPVQQPVQAPAPTSGSSRSQRQRSGSQPRGTNGASQPKQRTQKPKVQERPAVSPAAQIPVAPVMPAPAIPAVAPIVVPVAPAQSQQAPIAASTAVQEPPAAGSSVIDHGTTSTAPAPAPVPPVVQAPENRPALVVSDHLVDLGEARWNSKNVRKINLLNVGGGEMRGTVVATQPWVALNMQNFQGNAQTVEVRVRPRELPFGRVELHVPNLFAIIWARTKWALPFIGFWFWVVLLVASSLGKMLLTGLLALAAGLLVAEVLIWWWAMHVRLLVPAEKLNSGKLLVKSSGGEQQIEVRVRARPSAARKVAGWVLAAALFAGEIALVAWAALTWAGYLPLPGQ